MQEQSISQAKMLGMDVADETKDSKPNYVKLSYDIETVSGSWSRHKQDDYNEMLAETRKSAESIVLPPPSGSTRNKRRKKKKKSAQKGSISAMEHGLEAERMVLKQELTSSRVALEQMRKERLQLANEVARLNDRKRKQFGDIDANETELAKLRLALIDKEAEVSRVCNLFGLATDVKELYERKTAKQKELDDLAVALDLAQDIDGIRKAYDDQKAKLDDLRQKLKLAEDIKSIEVFKAEGTRVLEERHKQIQEIAATLKIAEDVKSLDRERESRERHVDALRKEQKELEELVTAHNWTINAECLQRATSFLVDAKSIVPIFDPSLMRHTVETKASSPIWMIHKCTNLLCTDEACLMPCDAHSNTRLKKAQADHHLVVLDWKHPSNFHRYSFDLDKGVQTNKETGATRRIHIQQLDILEMTAASKPWHVLDPIIYALHPETRVSFGRLRDSDPEYEYVRNIFCLSSKVDGKRNMLSAFPSLKIVEIQRVINPKAAREYAASRCNSTNKTERIGFHGTRANSHELVAKNGLNPCLSAKACLLGTAAYIAHDALYSSFYCHPAADGTRSMLMVYSLVGNRRVLQKGETDLAKVWRDMGSEYDSLGSVFEDTEVTAFQDRHRLYVSHVIKYKL